MTDLLEATLKRIRPLDDLRLAEQMEAHWDALTKPPGSLGKLERLVVHLGLIQGTPTPSVARKGLIVFCGDHGVTAEGVSPYPSEVTRQMVRNFVAGGAAINVLCRQYGIQTMIVDAGISGDPGPGVVELKTGAGTRNMVVEAAMTREQTLHAVDAGIELALAVKDRYDVVGIGEMGIGNTTAAAALLSAFSGRNPEETVGAGTSTDPAHVLRKRTIVQQALLRHKTATDPISMLGAFGGFEIATMSGFLIGAAAVRLPVVVDGFIASSAALVSRALSPDSLDAAIFSHRSAERGHALMLEFLAVSPLLDLDLRLGEGTGAAIAINLLETAVRLYSEMATFSRAGVSGAH
ncbi:MAG TPA: nicotinate-nucleotide--dimethylbenzimidazole phosphoribosyltransferase [Solibacterales bacterium]|nr:nicotinate-nucleotide--dimethylbenzimidazole phosphoribosyltransferase [Bryobacterales bacterium]